MSTSLLEKITRKPLCDGTSTHFSNICFKICPIKYINWTDLLKGGIRRLKISSPPQKKCMNLSGWHLLHGTVHFSELIPVCICLCSGVWCVTRRGKSTLQSSLCWWDPSLDTWCSVSLLTGKIFMVSGITQIHTSGHILQNKKQKCNKKFKPTLLGLAATQCWSCRCCSCWCLAWLWPSPSTCPCSAPCASLRASAWPASPFLYMSSVSFLFSITTSVLIAHKRHLIPFFVLLLHLSSSLLQDNTFTMKTMTYTLRLFEPFETMDFQYDFCSLQIFSQTFWQLK